MEGSCAHCGEKGRIFARGLIRKCYHRLRQLDALENYPRAPFCDYRLIDIDETKLTAEDLKALQELRSAEHINQGDLLENSGPRLERMMNRAVQEAGYYVPLEGGGD